MLQNLHAIHMTLQNSAHTPPAIVGDQRERFAFQVLRPVEKAHKRTGGVFEIDEQQSSWRTADEWSLTRDD